MVHQLIPTDQMEDQKRMFIKCDLNKDGSISKDELIHAFKTTYGDSDIEEEVKDIILLADLNGNGELDYSEWLVATMDRKEMITSKKLNQAF